MSNVLSDDKKQQVIALGRLGWSLRRIEAAVHIRRETVAGYVRAMGIPVRPPGGWGKLDPAKPANEVITDFDGGFGQESIPEDLDTVTDLLKIGDALTIRGYAPADVEAIMGGNMIRKLRQALPAS